MTRYPLAFTPIALSLLVFSMVVAFSRWQYTPFYLTGVGDTADYASMGKNLAAGRGFTTSVVYPLQLSPDYKGFLPHPFDPERIPNLHRPPLWPLWLGGVFTLLGVKEFWVWASSCLFLLGVVVVALRRGTDLVIAAPLLLFPPSVRYAASGLTEPPAALICLLFFLVLGSRKPLSLSRSAWIGVLAALGFLLKSYLLLLLPIAWLGVLFMKPQPAKARGLLSITLAFCLVAGPWWVRNSLLTDQPLFLLQSGAEWTKGLSGYEEYRAHRSTQSVETGTLIRSHIQELPTKMLERWFRVLAADAGAHAILLLCAFVLVLRREMWRRRLAPPLTAWVLVFVSLGPINLEPRFLYCLEIPLLFLVLEQFSQREDFQRWSRCLCLYFLMVVAVQAWPWTGDRDLRKEKDFLKTQFDQGDLVLTDADGLVAWETGATAVWWPADETALDSILNRYPVTGIYLQEGETSPLWKHFKVEPGAVLYSLSPRFSVQSRTPLGGFLLTEPVKAVATPVP